jgi:hypothetical protein
MEHLLQQIAATGLMGLIAALALWVAWKKDAEVRECREKMIAMAEKSAERYHALAHETNQTIAMLAEGEEIEK